MLSDLAKDLLASYIDLNDTTLLRMDWLPPLLTSFAQSNDASIQKAIQMIIDRALNAGISEGIDSAERDDVAAAKALAEEKLVADV